MFRFGEPEGGHRGYFGHDRLSVTPGGLLLGEGFFGGFLLRIIRVKDRRPVLAADIRPLAVERGRIVALPENPEQFFITDLFRSKTDLDSFGVAGPAAADIVVGWFAE